MTGAVYRSGGWIARPAAPIVRHPYRSSSTPVMREDRTELLAAFQSFEEKTHHGYSKATLGGSEKYQESSRGRQTQADSKTLAEENTTRAGARSCESQKSATLKAPSEQLTVSRPEIANLGFDHPCESNGFVFHPSETSRSRVHFSRRFAKAALNCDQFPAAARV